MSQDNRSWWEKIFDTFDVNVKVQDWEVSTSRAEGKTNVRVNDRRLSDGTRTTTVPPKA